MKKSSSPLGLTTVHWAFLALFPGFFFYDSALGIGVIGPVLGGYFSPVALVFTPILAWLYLRQIKQNKWLLTPMDFVFFAFLLYFFFVLALNFANGANPTLVRNHLLAVDHLFVVFIVFKMAEFDSKWFQKLAFISLIGMTIIIFTLSVNGFFNLKRQNLIGDTESLSTYQGFARSYLVTFLVVMPFIKSILLRLCLYLICIPALFVNGARSEFVALACIIVLAEFFYAKHRWVILFSFAIPAAFFHFSSDDFIKILPDNRVLELLDISQSTSWQARHSLSLHALKTIGEHPLLGDYGNYVAGSCCFYTGSHNILSAWIDLGFVGFVYLLCMTMLPMYVLSIDLFSRKTRTESEELLLAFSLMFVTLLLLFTAKDFTFMLIGAALGRYARYKNRQANAPEYSLQK